MSLKNNFKKNNEMHEEFRKLLGLAGLLAIIIITFLTKVNCFMPLKQLKKISVA